MKMTIKTNLLIAAVVGAALFASTAAVQAAERHLGVIPGQSQNAGVTTFPDHARPMHDKAERLGTLLGQEYVPELKTQRPAQFTEPNRFGTILGKS